MNFSRTLSVLALAACTAGAVAVPAEAAGPIVNNRAELRDCIRLDLRKVCRAQSALPKNTAVTMVCWRDGIKASGSVRWFYVTKGSRKGFVHSSLIPVNRQAKVKNCETHNGVSASVWAAEHVGKKEPGSGEAQQLGISNGRWSGNCAAFTKGAYMLGMKKRKLSYHGVSAADRYRHYLKVIKSMSKEPALGSQVFWETLGGSDGHVAIYVGNGQIVTTKGAYNSAPQPIVRAGLSSYPPASGWLDPDQI